MRRAAIAGSISSMDSATESLAPLPAGTVLRHDLRPGDLGAIVRMHGTIYAREYNFDLTFEAYVAGPLAEFVRTRTARDRLWIIERGDDIVGCVAIVGTWRTEAQLRWYLVDPSARGLGLGRRLLGEAIAFCRQQAYESVFLWTVSALTAAARLYRAFGFQRVAERPGRLWGVDVVEERFVLDLRRPPHPDRMTIPRQSE